MTPLENRLDEPVRRPLERALSSIPQWVLPAAIAVGAAALIGAGAYLNARHDREMDRMREWYEQNPQVYEQTLSGARALPSYGSHD